LKTNKLAVVLICALAGLAASCRVVAPHAMFGPSDDPQAKKGKKAQWSSADKHDYDIYFAPDNPCKESPPIKLVSGKIATCTVTGMEQNLYPYTVVPAGASPTSTPSSAHILVIPCKGCGVTAFRVANTTFHTDAPVGASASITKDAKIYLISDCENKRGFYTDLCVHTKQYVQWGFTGVSKATITFPSAAQTPCFNGGTPVPSITGDTTVDGSLPIVCTIGSGVSAATYPYTVTVTQAGGGTQTSNDSVTVK
jgi:hypothetical protein